MTAYLDKMLRAPYLSQNSAAIEMVYTIRNFCKHLANACEYELRENQISAEQTKNTLST